MATKEEIAAKLAVFQLEQERLEAELAEIEQDRAELEALERDRQRVIDAHENRRKFCEYELTLPLKERSPKPYSQPPEPRDDDAVNAELAALVIDCARMLVPHDEAIANVKARIARRQG